MKEIMDWKGLPAQWELRQLVEQERKGGLERSLKIEAKMINVNYYSEQNIENDLKDILI